MKLGDTEKNIIAMLCTRESLTIESEKKRNYNAARSLVKKGIAAIRYESATSICLELTESGLAEFAIKNPGAI